MNLLRLRENRARLARGGEQDLSFCQEAAVQRQREVLVEQDLHDA